MAATAARGRGKGESGNDDGVSPKGQRVRLIGLRTQILFAAIHSATCVGRVSPASTRRHERLNGRHASRATFAPSPRVASESRALARVRSGELVVGISSARQG